VWPSFQAISSSLISGAVVIPAALVTGSDIAVSERLEGWIMGETRTARRCRAVSGQRGEQGAL
jgi:hypothetical protein